MQKKYVEGEWIQLKKTEQKFLHQNRQRKIPKWQEKVADYVPDKLENTLDAAFYKAFETIFEKGTGLIEKTYPKEKKERDYQMRECNATIQKNKSSLQAFGKTAGNSQKLHMAVSAVEGVGMGVLGMGIPDIPLFLSVLLRSIYEQALSYGFSYDTEEEQIFILQMIEASLAYGTELQAKNKALNHWIANEAGNDKIQCRITRKEQIRKTADVLSKEMLYLKFVQGLPVIGVVGGISDVVYQKKISEYTAMKYKRRFLEKKREPWYDKKSKN